MRIFRTISYFITVVSALALCTQAWAGSPPQQLRNKSVTIGWAEAFVSRRVSDNVRTSGISKFEVVVYVSSAGRAFTRAGGGTNRHHIKADRGPENTPVNFSGTTMTAHQSTMEIARRLTATFDPSFASCTASVTIGKMKQNARLKGFDGAEYEMIEKIPSALSCSISEGNRFGG